MNLRRVSSMLFLLVLLLSAGCSSDADIPQEYVEIPVDVPDDESWNMSLVISDSNIVKARMKFGHARRYVSRMETIVDSNVYVEFYNPSGEITATLIADSARIDDRTKDMSAYGAVHVKSDQNQTVVDTDRLFWDSKRRHIHSDARVKVVDNVRQQTIEGTGFDSDESLKNYTFYNVSGTIRQSP